MRDRSFERVYYFRGEDDFLKEGTVRELVVRALRQLERDGLIARRRSAIVVRDPERLAALARGETAET